MVLGNVGGAQAPGPVDRQVRHGVGAGVGADRDGDVVAVAERQHAVDVLAAGGMAEQAVALRGGDPLVAQRLEQTFVDAEGPLLARVGGAAGGVQVAEVVPEVFGEGCLGEFDGDGEGVGRIDVRQPVVSVVATVAGDAVVDEQDGQAGMPGRGAGGVEGQLAIGEGGIEIG